MRGVESEVESDLYNELRSDNEYLFIFYLSKVDEIPELFRLSQFTNISCTMYITSPVISDFITFNNNL